MDMSGELDEMMEAWGLIGGSQCDPMHAPFGIVGKPLMSRGAHQGGFTLFEHACMQCKSYS
jgi:hypothetical protein